MCLLATRRGEGRGREAGRSSWVEPIIMLLRESGRVLVPGSDAGFRARALNVSLSCRALMLTPPRPPAAARAAPGQARSMVTYCHQNTHKPSNVCIGRGLEAL